MMTQLLILGATVLARGPFTVTDTEIRAEDSTWPKHVVPGWEIVETDAPEDFTPGEFEWVGEKLVGKATDAEAAFNEKVKHYDSVVQNRLDEVARGFGYGDPNRPDVSPILHAISYADEPAVVEFQAEGRLLRAWRSKYWAACWPILEAVRGGQRPIPGENDLVAELDVGAPPPTPQQVAAEIASLSAS